MIPLLRQRHATEHDGERRTPTRAIVGSVIGLLLFAAAIWAIASREQDVRDSLDAARRAPWWLVASVLLLPIVNWLAVSGSFHVLQNRYGPVGHAEMAALIASAWLLNYLPMKPGLIGRVAYHKKVNGIRYKDSARVIAFSVGLSAAALGLLVVIAVLVRTGGDRGWAWCLPVPVVLAVLAAVWRTTGRWWWRLAVSGLLRYLDTMAWVGRYAAAFALIGEPIGFETAIVVAAVSQASFLIPISGNGLGIREWAVRAVTTPAGLLADVVNRAAELAVALPLGAAGTLYASRRLARAGAPGAYSVDPPG